jgi:hypothetical protein
VALGGDRAALVANQVSPADRVAAFRLVIVARQRGDHPYLARRLDLSVHGSIVGTALHIRSTEPVPDTAESSFRYRYAGPE